MQIRVNRSVLAIGILALLAAISLEAQQSGTITGTVTDQIGKALPNAAVEVRNELTAASRTTATDNDGKFGVQDLAIGTYTIVVSSPGFAVTTRSGGKISAGATLDITIPMSVESLSTSITVNETISMAAATAPSGNTLEAVSAKTEVSGEFIRNFMSPLADYSEYVNLAPGTFSLNPNGIGLGQGKTYFRGFQDGQYTITFDGIPFEDTNTPTHHSWASFPSQWISSTDFDRSPGQASDFGPTNFGGSINLKSPELQADPDIRGTFSIGSFNTKLYSLDAESGLFGPKKEDSVLVNINAMTSDGYQTYNYQKRDAGFGKYQHRFSPKTSLSLYGGVVDIFNNTPNTTNPTRGEVALFGDNFLLNNCPVGGSTGTNCTPGVAAGQPDPNYYGYEHYHVQTDFEYAAYTTDFGNGWKLDTKAYTTRYWNKQFYQN